MGPISRPQGNQSRRTQTSSLRPPEASTSKFSSIGGSSGLQSSTSVIASSELKTAHQGAQASTDLNIISNLATSRAISQSSTTSMSPDRQQPPSQTSSPNSPMVALADDIERLASLPRSWKRLFVKIEKAWADMAEKILLKAQSPILRNSCAENGEIITNSLAQLKAQLISTMFDAEHNLTVSQREDELRHQYITAAALRDDYKQQLAAAKEALAQSPDDIPRLVEEISSLKRQLEEEKSNKPGISSKELFTKNTGNATFNYQELYELERSTCKQLKWHVEELERLLDNYRGVPDTASQTLTRSEDTHQRTAIVGQRNLNHDPKPKNQLLQPRQYSEACSSGLVGAYSIQPAIIDKALPGKPLPTDGTCLIIKQNLTVSGNDLLTSDQMLAKLKATISPKRLGVHLVSVFAISQARVCVICASSNDADKLKIEIQKHSFFEVKIMTRRNPLLRLSKFTTDINPTQLIEDIRVMNQDIPDISQGVIRFAFLRKNGRHVDVILECEPTLYSRLIDRGYLYAEYMKARVSSYSNHRQCYRCQGFGHIASKCQGSSTNTEVCGYCSDNHRSSTCPYKNKPEEHKCINCIKYNKGIRSQLRKLDVNHHTFSNRCQVANSMRLAAEKMTDTGHQTPSQA